MIIQARSHHWHLVLLSGLAALVLLVGCAAAPAPLTHAPGSTPQGNGAGDIQADFDRSETRLGQFLKQHKPEPLQGAEAGFGVLAVGPDAFLSLRSLIHLADRSLDLQYYNWRADRTGHILLADLVDAADRGVRVRMLLDDMDLRWEDDDLARLNKHPNLEIRLFNPFIGRDTIWYDLLFDFDRITHRMHNKAFIADEVVAIVGGRNVGDRYFELADEGNYRDLDLYAAGPAAVKVSHSFEEFWNSAWAVPIEALDTERQTPADVQDLRVNLGQSAIRLSRVLAMGKDGPDAWAGHVQQMFAQLEWTASWDVVSDSPDKPRTSDSELIEHLRTLLQGRLQKELLMETAYLIPGAEGIATFCKLVEAGISVKILTNSLASNDVITGYSAYSNYRKPLLHCGVSLYEMQAEPAFLEKSQAWRRGNGIANLHSKAAVLDDRYVVVGSFNTDPRSVHLNTEIVLIVDSRPLAGRVGAFIKEGMRLDNAYQVTLENDALMWHGREDGNLIRTTQEPGATFFRSLTRDFLSLIPMEGQL